MVNLNGEMTFQCATYTHSVQTVLLNGQKQLQKGVLLAYEEPSFSITASCKYSHQVYGHQTNENDQVNCFLSYYVLNPSL